MKKFFRWFCLLLLFSSLTGCFSWLRAYQTYLQMHDFDENFSISSENKFSVHFKNPLLYSDDFVSLSKLQASEKTLYSSGKKWRYIFRKMDKDGHLIKPEVNFYFDLYFDNNNLLTEWVFSPLFLEIAPAEFLEVSLRSLADAEINTGEKQLRTNFDYIEKTSAKLPQKAQVLSKLGKPLKIKSKKTEEKYYYHFQLDTAEVEKGYEDRKLSVIKLTFDKASSQLLKMAGRFAGLKISIDYRKYQGDDMQSLVKLSE